MMFRIAIAMLALAAPVFAQHGGHAGFTGSRGFAGRSGFSGSPGFSRSFVSHAPAFRYSAPSARNGASGGAGFRGPVPPRYSGFRIPYNSSYRVPYNGNRFSAGRAPYHRSDAGRSGDRNRDRYDRRRRSFNNWYNNYYPTWLGYGYPYAVDPGSYDWDDSDSGDSEQPSAYGQASSYGQGSYGHSSYGQSSYGYDQGGAAPAYPAPYPDESYGAPDGYRPSYRPSAAQAPAAVSAPLTQQPLTVIFKDGRAPIKMQNYMMTATVLTDLDTRHYERIPLGQIDTAATQRVNSAAGVTFQVPGAVRD